MAAKCSACWPGLLQGHRLVALAKTHGKGHEANALLFRKS